MKFFSLVSPVVFVALRYRGSNFINIYIPAIILEIAIMFPQRRLNTNVGRPIFSSVPNIPDVAGQALALWLSFVPLSNSAISVFLYGAHTAPDVSMSGRTRRLTRGLSAYIAR